MQGAHFAGSKAAIASWQVKSNPFIILWFVAVDVVAIDVVAIVVALIHTSYWPCKTNLALIMRRHTISSLASLFSVQGNIPNVIPEDLPYWIIGQCLIKYPS